MSKNKKRTLVGLLLVVVVALGAGFDLRSTGAASQALRGEMADPLSYYYGTASWFCCGDAYGPCGDAGGGSCGDCQSGSYHAAWPKLKRPGYSDCDHSGCGMSLPWKYCGDSITVKSLCSNDSVTVYVHDCGPDQQNYCDMSVACGSCGSDCSALVDLTPAAFSAIEDLDLGRIPARVSASGKSKGETTFLGGTVSRVEKDRLIIESRQLVSTLYITDDTRLWKGKVVSLNQIELGDKIFARAIPRAGGEFTATKVWVNIGNVYGVLVEKKDSILVLRIGGPDSKSVLTVHIDADTLLNEVRGVDLSALSLGQPMQALGVYQRDNSLLATRLWTSK